ncbi:hypothetical protein EDB84DRAFT_185439 [Lactarius hengduanensis]|nr:hypothetical protein EDB84DRAFT_185439 [Lactarius hengduanensis]
MVPLRPSPSRGSRATAVCPPARPSPVRGTHATAASVSPPTRPSATSSSAAPVRPPPGAPPPPSSPTLAPRLLRAGRGLRRRLPITGTRRTRRRPAVLFCATDGRSSTPETYTCPKCKPRCRFHLAHSFMVPAFILHVQAITRATRTTTRRTLAASAGTGMASRSRPYSLRAVGRAGQQRHEPESARSHVPAAIAHVQAPATSTTPAYPIARPPPPPAFPQPPSRNMLLPYGSVPPPGATVSCPVTLASEDGVLAVWRARHDAILDLRRNAVRDVWWCREVV